MISDLEAANETMGESTELLGKIRRNELIEEEEMEVTEEEAGGGSVDGGGGGRRPRL